MILSHFDINNLTWMALGDDNSATLATAVLKLHEAQQKNITTEDIAKFLEYIKQNEAQYDSFNVAIAQTILSSLMHFVQGLREKN